MAAVQKCDQLELGKLALQDRLRLLSKHELQYQRDPFARAMARRARPISLTR